MNSTKESYGKFVTNNINDIMKRLPNRIIFSGLIVLIISVILLVMISFSIKLPIMINVQGKIYDDSTAVAALSKRDLLMVHVGQRTVISVKTNKGIIIEDGEIYKINIDTVGSKTFIKLKGKLQDKISLSNEIAFISIQVNQLSLIKKMWN